MLGLTVLLVLLDPASAGDRWLVAGLAALSAAWHLGFQRLGPDGQRPGPAAGRERGNDHRRPALVVFGSLFALWITRIIDQSADG